MKFLVDMPLSPATVRWLEQQGHDAVHASTIGLERASDTLILTRAAADHRIVLTAGLDYPRLRRVIEADVPALILFRGALYTERDVIDHLTRVLRTIPEPDLTHEVLVIHGRRGARGL